MGTHINAFYMSVDEAKQGVEEAKGKLQAAEEALKAHPDYVAPKATKSKPSEVARSAKNGKFVSKDKAKKEPDTTVTEKIPVRKG